MSKLISLFCKKCNKYFQSYVNSSHLYEIQYCSRTCANNRYGTYIERFFKYISNDYHTNNCWEWTRVKSHQGYGTITINNKPVRAHRFSWELYYDKIPCGKLVCHKCDNPSCVNPEHLFLGTHTDNNQDTVKKGRNINIKGSKHPRSILTENIVLEIRTKLSAGKTGKELSKEYGICKSHISMIKNRKMWSHI